ncbi:MAG TPA: ribose 5-phosphate isomerase B [Bryobacteraceae bacterium]|nr:ribose 5-phosphate isomerase B [Bryobacteraceae bacterium]
MRIAIGSDHAGFTLKEYLRDALTRQGHQVTDYGPSGPESVDYPDYAAPVARDVASAKADRGVLVCYTGVGMSIAANKIPGVRAALGTCVEEVRLVRGHNDANVLTIGAKFTQPAEAAAMVHEFLQTEFEGGRHARRTGKITALEQPAGAAGTSGGAGK